MLALATDDFSWVERRLGEVFESRLRAFFSLFSSFL
ncbi:MAG: hypothetical protein ACI9G1_003623 [Pirellulaceae bacterium]|jgi:hypothetical protein